MSAPGPGERALILHVDDLGLCEETQRAWELLWAEGSVWSGSLMAPAPGFSEAVAWARAHPEADLGLHLTLTSEWERRRWPALRAHPSLRDRDGCLPMSFDALNAQASREAVAEELAAQLAFARDAGLRPTHLDTHMWCLLRAPWLDLYCELALNAGLPCVLSAPWVERLGPDGEGVRAMEPYRERLPLVHIAHLRGPDPSRRVERYTRLIEELPEGLTHMVVHPAVDGEALRDFADDWELRVADFRALADGALDAIIRRAGVRRAQWRDLGPQTPPVR